MERAGRAGKADDVHLHRHDYGGPGKSFGPTPYTNATSRIRRSAYALASSSVMSCPVSCLWRRWNSATSLGVGFGSNFISA